MAYLIKALTFWNQSAIMISAMWSLANLRASRVTLRRIFLQLTATLVVAVFATILAASPAMAADATWSGDTLQYEGKTFTQTTNPKDLPGSPHEYESIDTSTNPHTATVLYLGGADPHAATSATLIVYDYSSSTLVNPYASSSQTLAYYTNPRAQQAVTVAPGGGPVPTSSTCDTEVTLGLGWIICPISNFISKAVDGVYKILEDFLLVPPTTMKTTDPKTGVTDYSGIYKLWDIIRSLANICFVIAFLVIIYSQITGLGISSHGLKTMIPRLIIAVILVNVSFWISSLAVDLSNALGRSAYVITQSIHSGMTLQNPDINWGNMTNVVLAGGSAATAHLGFAVAAGGSPVSLGFTLLAALLSVAGAILVAFIILAARQAIIVVLVVLSPLAFVAYLLPNTRSLFSKWGKSFMTLLVFFPMFGLLFGGAQIAGTLIMQSANGRLHILIAGLATQIVPLIITPLLVRFSTGILGQVANFANSSSRGLIDRARNWATENADYHKAKNIAKNDNMISANPATWLNAARLGRTLNQNKLKRDAYKKEHDETAANRAESSRLEAIEGARPAGPGYFRSPRERSAYRHRQQMRHSHDMHMKAEEYRKGIEADDNEHWQHNMRANPEYAALRARRTQTEHSTGRADLNDNAMKAADQLSFKKSVTSTPYLRQLAEDAGVKTKEAGAHQESIDAAVDEQWSRRQQSDSTLRAMRTETHLAKGRAKVIDERMTAKDQKQFDTLVAQGSGGWLQIRDDKVQTIRDTEHAQFQASRVEAQGKRAYQADWEDGTPEARKLQKQFAKTEQLKKEAATIANTVQKRADAHWDNVSRTDDTVKALRLKEVSATDSQRLAETNWNSLVEDVRLHGSDSAHITRADQAAAARSIRQLNTDTVAAERTVEATKSIHQSRAQTEFIESAAGKRINMQAQAAKDELAVAQADEEALAQEWRTEEGAKNLTGQEAEIAKELRDSYTKKRAQAQRSNAAAGIADQEYAKQVLEGEHIPDGTETIAQVAGGIAGASGVSQAKATAKQTVVEAANKAVAAERTLVSQVKEDTILSDKIGSEKGLGSKDILREPTERIAALASSIAGRYHMQSHIKLWGRMGELSRQANSELEAAQESGDPDAIAAAEAEVSKVKDMQQQVMADRKKKPFGVSDQDDGNATVGIYSGNLIESHRERLKTHLAVEKLAEMDPDDLRLTYELARAGKLDQDTMDNIVDIYDQWKKDPILNKRLAPKLTKFLDPIVMDNNGDRSGYDTIPETAYGEVSMLDNRRGRTS